MAAKTHRFPNRHHGSRRTPPAAAGEPSKGTTSRTAWSGLLKLSLVAIPVRVSLATNPSSDVRFRQLHRKCHTPIQLKKWCPTCEKEVAADDIVKGYEVSKGRYALVEEEEIKRVRPESTRTIDLTHLLDTSTIDPLYIERSYFVAPETKAAGSAFAVLRDALENRAGIGRVAIHGREYLAAVVPRDSMLLMNTLRTQGELRDAKTVQGLEFADAKPKPEEVRLARQILESLTEVPDLTQFTDHYQEALREMLSRKREEVVLVAGETKQPSNVVNLMDALRQSLARTEHTRADERRSVKHRRKAS